MTPRPQPTAYRFHVTGMSRLALAILLASLVSLSASPSRGADEESLIDQALSQSGTTAQVESLPAAVLLAVPGDVFPDTKTREAVTAAVKKSATADSLVAPLREALRSDFHEESIEKVIAFYDTRTGRKVARIQTRGLAPDLLKTIREGRKTAVSMDEKRLDLLHRLIKADRVGETNSVLVTMLIDGLFHGSATEAGNGKPAAPEGSQEHHAGARTEAPRVEELALVGYAHTFRSLDDKELAELAEFKESEAGIWFQKRVLKGLQETVARVGASLAEALQKARSS